MKTLDEDCKVDEDPRDDNVPDSPGQEFLKPASAAETCSQARRERKNTRKDSCSTATKVEKKNVRMTTIKLNKDIKQVDTLYLNYI